MLEQELVGEGEKREGIGGRWREEEGSKSLDRSGGILWPPDCNWHPSSSYKNEHPGN